MFAVKPLSGGLRAPRWALFSAVWLFMVAWQHAAMVGAWLQVAAAVVMGCSHQAAHISLYVAVILGGVCVCVCVCVSVNVSVCVYQC